MPDLYHLPTERPLPAHRYVAARRQLSEVPSMKPWRLLGRWRNTGIVIGLGVGLSVGGGVALATGVFSQRQPGAPSDTQLSHVVSVTRTGTATIDLGPAPTSSERHIAHVDRFERRHLSIPRRFEPGLFAERSQPSWSRRLSSSRSRSTSIRSTHGDDHHERQRLVEVAGRLHRPSDHCLEDQCARANLRRAEQAWVSRPCCSGVRPRPALGLREVDRLSLPYGRQRRKRCDPGLRE